MDKINQILMSIQHTSVGSLCVEKSLLTGLNHESYFNQRNSQRRNQSCYYQKQETH